MLSTVLSVAVKYDPAAHFSVLGSQPVLGLLPSLYMLSPHGVHLLSTVLSVAVKYDPAAHAIVLGSQPVLGLFPSLYMLPPHGVHLLSSVNEFDLAKKNPVLVGFKIVNRQCVT